MFDIILITAQSASKLSGLKMGSLKAKKKLPTLALERRLSTLPNVPNSMSRESNALLASIDTSHTCNTHYSTKYPYSLKQPTYLNHVSIFQKLFYLTKYNTMFMPQCFWGPGESELTTELSQAPIVLSLVWRFLRAYNPSSPEEHWDNCKSEAYPVLKHTFNASLED